MEIYTLDSTLLMTLDPALSIFRFCGHQVCSGVWNGILIERTCWVIAMAWSSAR